MASALVITDVCSTRRCAGITRIVTSLSIPKEPSPRRARRNASPRLDSVIFTTTPNLDGVTSVSEVMNSSTGGIDEPVPCAPAETTHLPAVQQYLPDLVNPCGPSASNTFETRAPASTAKVMFFVST